VSQRQFPLGRGFLYGLYQKKLRRQLEGQQLPRHVAMIIDGNRRWAKLKDLETVAHGHRAGAAKYREFLVWCDDLDISVATLYLLSTDNLTSRSPEELRELFTIIGDLAEDLSHFRDWRVQHVGSDAGLPDQLKAQLAAAHDRTATNSGLHVNLAIGYGGRHEIAEAMRNIVRNHCDEGHSLEALAELLTPELISEHLYTKGQPDPDLVIRTSGEQRISDFMLWQTAHSELYFVEALGPDLREVDFLRALRDFARRHRRYGA
jgi:short-chain Z-isoprenyl diphosphate synthase